VTVALVTGGGSGIGEATARAFARVGHHVAVTDLDGDAAARVAAVIVAAGGTAVGHQLDVTVEADVEGVHAAVVEAWGSLDVACNAAGMPGTFAALADQTLADFERTVAVNLTGTFLCLRAQVPRMVAAGSGAVVNVSSAAGQMGFAHLPAYVASKHGVVGITRSVALEVAAKGVRVNAVCPGSIRTPMLEGFVGGNEDALLAMGKTSPMRRLGRADEVAESILWLCSDAASFVTGQALGVDGGVLAT